MSYIGIMYPGRIQCTGRLDEVIRFIGPVFPATSGRPKWYGPAIIPAFAARVMFREKSGIVVALARESTASRDCPAFQSLRSFRSCRRARRESGRTSSCCRYVGVLNAVFQARLRDSVGRSAAAPAIPIRDVDTQHTLGRLPA